MAGITIPIEVKIIVTSLLGSLASILTILEVTSYIIFFLHITKHNNTIAANVLKPSVIKQRNRASAVSMYGQLAGWVMEIWYAVILIFFSTFYDADTLREVASLIKDFEFVLIPLVEVQTSFPIITFLSQKRKE